MRPRSPITALLARFLGRLRYPQLFGLFAVLLLISLAVPDTIPFVDELLFAVGALLFGSLKARRPPG